MEHPPRRARSCCYTGRVGYGEERLDLVARLRRQAPGRSLTDLLRLDGRAMRFHVGTSLADLRVPVHVDAAVGAAVRAAVRDLFFLLSIRHRASLREREYDRLILLDGFNPKGVRQVSFNAPASVKSDNVRRAFLEAPELHPALDAGLMASWLTTGRPGRTLAGILNALLRRAQVEAGGPDRPEPTAYLVLLALRSRFRTALHTLRDLPVSGPVGRTLHGAVAAGLLRGAAARHPRGGRAHERVRRAVRGGHLRAALAGRAEGALGQRAARVRRGLRRARCLAAWTPTRRRSSRRRPCGGGPRRSHRRGGLQGGGAQGGAAGGPGPDARGAARRSCA